MAKAKKALQNEDDGSRQARFRRLRYSFLLLIPLVIVVTTVIGIAYILETNRDRKVSAHEESANADLHQQVIETAFTAIRSDLALVSRTATSSDLFAESSSSVDLGGQLIDIAVNTNFYSSIQIMDHRGQQLIKVDADQKKPVLVDDSELVNKSGMPYFTGTIGISAENIYASPISMHQASDSDEPRSVIRFGGPIEDETGETVGVVLITAYVDDMLQQLFASHDNHNMIIITQQTTLSFSMDGVEIGDTVEILQNKFTDDWPTLLAMDSGQNISASGVHTIRSILPLEGKALTDIGSASNKFEWKMIHFVPIGQLAAGDADRQYIMGLLWIVMMVGSLGFSFLFGSTIARRREDQSQLLASAEEWNLTFSSLSDGVSIHDTDHTIVRANSALGEMLGVDPEQLLGKKCYDVFHDKECPIDGCPMCETMETKSGASIEFFEPKLNEWLQISTSPIFDEKSMKITGSVHVVHNISKRKEAEKTIADSETRFRSIVETTEEIISRVDTNGRILYMSPSGLTTYGIEEQEVLGMNITEFALPEYRDLLVKELDTAKTTSSAVRYRYLSHTVEGPRWHECILSPLKDEGGQVTAFTRISRDVHEQKIADEKSRRHLRRLDALRSIDHAIGSSLDMRLTLKVLLDHVSSELSADAASILLLDSDDQTLVYADTRGFRDDMSNTSFRVNECHAGQAVLERSTVITPVLEPHRRIKDSKIFSEEEFVGYFAAPLIAKGQVKGVLEVFTRKPMKPGKDWINFFETLAGQAAIAIDNATLFEQLQRSNSELSRAYDATLEGWSKALDLRDEETEGHARRVVAMTIKIARRMGFSESELVHIRRGALLHDMGKLGIPDSILLKPGALDDDEWKIMRLHPVYAYDMLNHIKYLRPALDIPYGHHEKWDGSGYPRGLAAEEIPLSARIFAIVDVWDALSSDRPYRKAWPRDRVMKTVTKDSGTHFDPKVVEIFLELESNQPVGIAEVKATD